uniref:FUZ/MON1/HPS1 first Longin domain-containing protein n=1 Tax=Heliothis virescens TaxID=7102 RepID=A0A2A4JQR1_HELVI
MKAALIFDTVNDLVFGKWDSTFIERLKTFSIQENQNDVTENNTVSQLLAPIITSQRVMAAQFGNTYSSIQCKDKTTIVFDEWLDHVFMIISEDYVDDAHRELLDFKTFVQHICGQNINLLHSSVYQDWLSVLLDSRTKGDTIPGANGVIGESGATMAALNALKSVSKSIKLPHQHSHLMLFVGDKLLALYSSRGTEDLSPPDLILLSIQCIAAQEYWLEIKNEENNDLDDQEIIRLPWLSTENSAVVNLCAGPAGSPCAPHSIHLAEVAPRITFAVVVDMDLRETGISAYMSNQILSNLRRLLLQRNLELLPNTLDSLEAALKKTTDALRKNKANSNLCARLTSRMLELRKSCTTTTPLTPETTATAMHTALEAVIEQLKPDIPSLKMEQPLKDLRGILSPYVEFLCVKAKRYFSLGSYPFQSDILFRLQFVFKSTGETDASCSLTLHKYVEEFPGLIHFIYVDRTAGRFLAPDMADCADMLAPDTVRRAVCRSFAVVREGYCAATWRRGALHGCALVWWERRGQPVPDRQVHGVGERRGQPVRPATPPHPAAVRALPPPGDIRGSFYRYPTDKCTVWGSGAASPCGPPPRRTLPPCARCRRPGTSAAASTGTRQTSARCGGAARPARAARHPAAPCRRARAAAARGHPRQLLQVPDRQVHGVGERRGQPVRPATPPHPAAVRALPPPGDIRGSFYRYPTDKCTVWGSGAASPCGPPPRRTLPPCARCRRPGTSAAASTGTRQTSARCGGAARPARAARHPAAPCRRARAAAARGHPRQLLQVPDRQVHGVGERRGQPVRPATPPHPAAVRALPPPGDIRGSFYRYPTDKCTVWGSGAASPCGPPPRRTLPPCARCRRPGTSAAASTGTRQTSARCGGAARPARAARHPAAPCRRARAAAARGHPRQLLQVPDRQVHGVGERRGQPVRPATPPHPAAVRALPPPGDIRGSFYRQLLELAFPGDSRGVSVKELICIHLGLLPASTAVQQARRLAHSVHELAGDVPTGAADLL